MDEIDRQLLQILQRDATLSIAQMAERVGLAATPCWKRIQKLEAAGVITRWVALLDRGHVGGGLTVLVSIEAGEHTPRMAAPLQHRRRRHARGHGVLRRRQSGACKFLVNICPGIKGAPTHIRSK